MIAEPTVKNSPTTSENTDRFDAAGLSVVLGLGVTGLSCARYLTARGHKVLIVDSRERPPGLDALRLGCPGVEVTGPLLERGFVTTALDAWGVPHHVRFSFGTPEENEAFVAALGKVLGRS